MDKLTHKQISNYLANDLGLDRKAVEDIIKAKIDERNIPAMVRQAMEQYLHKGAGGWRADEFLRDAVYREVRKQIKDAVETGGRKVIDEVAQKQLDSILAHVDCPLNTPEATRDHRVMCVEFTRDWCGVKQDMVALFDIRDVSEEEVVQRIHENQTSHPAIAIISKAQYETVFRSLFRDPSKEVAPDTSSAPEADPA